MKKTPRIELQLYNWNHGTKTQQDNILRRLDALIVELATKYRKHGIDDNFTFQSGK